MGNLRSEKSGQEISNDATNTVLGKDIESVIYANPKLDLGGQVARNPANDSVNDSRPGRDEAGSRCDSDEACNDTTAEPNGAPLLL